VEFSCVLGDGADNVIGEPVCLSHFHLQANLGFDVWLAEKVG